MNNSNNFERDLDAEQVLGEFLEQYYYPNTDLENYNRISNQQEQYAGIDATANLDGNKILIDEKGLLSIPKPVH